MFCKCGEKISDIEDKIDVLQDRALIHSGDEVYWANDAVAAIINYLNVEIGVKPSTEAALILSKKGK